MKFISQRKEGKIYFTSDFFIGNGQTYFNFQYIYLKFFTLCTILDELVTFEIINGKFNTELIIPRQKY